MEGNVDSMKLLGLHVAALCCRSAWCFAH